ncbi:hypothetical protein ACU80C_30465 (plasmid) [Bacillus mycoides]|uniref:hypothetical protein n=1 Tax=unclassified Bacillus cereus group TaxID=2750818 RepID=UPI0024C5CF2A|nr:MAG: hypothetical protein NRZ50_08100 [Bacillus paranthracis]WAI33876.1 MAG: hypothetical protein NRZ52_06965 [Bacillus paranthracis]WAI37996.1 MAG: hypothetical protein NRZ51_25660 [Bacillus paranthracis]
MSRTKKAKESRFIFLISGLFVTGVSIYINFDDVISGRFPDAITIMSFALGINQLLMAYLSPHLFPKDERSKMILGKSMFVNYFVIFGTILFLFILTGFSDINWDAQQTLIVLTSILMLTIPTTMVIYSKII